MPFDLPSARFIFAMQSSVGRKRSGNEDFCAASPEDGVFVVCDGMGGAAAGEVASRLAGDTFVGMLQGVEEDLGPKVRTAVLAANNAFFEHAKRDESERGMGSTLVGLVLESPVGQGSRLWLVHVGDSRCYRLRRRHLEQLTEDHSLVQQQVRAGQLTPEQAERSPMRNIITRVVGSGATVEPELQELTVEPGDLYLLCSDGLTRELSDAMLKERLDSPERIEMICAGLIQAANEAGGHDNITALLLQID